MKHPNESNPQPRDSSAAAANWWRRMTTSPAVRRASIGGGVLLVAIAVSGLITATGPDGMAAPQTEKAWPVTVVQANPTELHPMFATYGRVEARTEAKLRTNIQAEVEEVYVREGEWAEAGELLIKFRDEELALSVREANAEADKAAATLRSTEVEYSMLQKTTSHFEEMHRISQQTLERQRELAKQRMIPQALLDTATQQASRDTIEYQNHQRALANFPSRIAQDKAALTVATARAEKASLDLQKTRLHAPFAGPVLSVAVGPGDRTNLAIELMTIADASTFEVRAAIPDQYADRVRQALNRKQSITAQLATDATQLKLSRVAHNVRPGQSGLDAWFRLDTDSQPNGDALGSQANSGLTLGRVINLTAVLPSEPNLVALPGQAVYNNNRVYLVHNNRLQAATVQRIGEIRLASGDHQVLVRGDNLSSGADVMTTALPKAITGLLVDPIRGQGQSQLENEAIVTTPAPQSRLEHPLQARPIQARDVDTQREGDTPTPSLPAQESMA